MTTLYATTNRQAGPWQISFTVDSDYTDLDGDPLDPLAVGVVTTFRVGLSGVTIIENDSTGALLSVAAGEEDGEYIATVFLNSEQTTSLTPKSYDWDLEVGDSPAPERSGSGEPLRGKLIVSRGMD